MAVDDFGWLDYKVSYTLKWGGGVWLSDIKRSAKAGVKEAVTIYFWELYRILNQHWGSIQELGGRRTIEHSPPGSPPYVQTQNLGNSLNVVYGARALRMFQGVTALSSELEVGMIYSDVPYAQVLEYGGLAGPYKAHELKYTSWRLLNPIRYSFYIEARPAWRPAYQLSVSRMIGAIVSNMRRVMKRTYIR